MSEKKNHLDIEGAQAKEDEHIASYKPIPEAETEFRTSKASLSKSREKVSDEAAEKLLKEDQVGIRVDMADAKYVVGDHRNGDAKIELDANKRQFTGLTKEELLKYADDPFWVRLRWFMFALFWALWLCMLVGAVAIIISAPKCAAPTPKTRFQKGPLVDLASASSLQELESSLGHLQKSKIQAIFIPGSLAGDTYKVLDEETALDQVKGFMKKAKDYGVGVIVDLTANFVPVTHPWFSLSENRTEPYANYFVWANASRDKNGNLTEPNNWRSTLDTSAWSLSPARQQYYLAQYGAGTADLNFREPAVVQQFDNVLKKWMSAGAAGVRLYKARELLTSVGLEDEPAATGAGAVLGATHEQRAFYRHQHTSDQPELDQLLAHWSHIVDQNSEQPGAGESVFTVHETGDRPELALLARNLTCLRPGSLAPLSADRPAAAAAAALAARLARWPALQLTSEAGVEIASFALLLPAAPVLSLDQIETDEKNETLPSESFARLAALRGDAAVQHGQHNVTSARAANSTERVLVVTRWKSGHTGYLAVWNPSQAEAVADLTGVSALPAALTLHHASPRAHAYTNYTNNQALQSSSLLVPPRSSLVLSFVPKTTAEK